VSHAHSVTPAQRRIALVASADAAASGDERSQHAMRLLDTMLWVLKGTTRDAWATATPEEADIVVIHRDDPIDAAAWKARGKLVVEISNEAASSDAGAHLLNYPFPAKRVLELLEKLSGELDSRTASAPAIDTGSARPAPAQDRWALAESLRTLRAVRNEDLWLVLRDGTDPVVWLRGDGSAWFATESFVHAARSNTALISRLELRDGYPPLKTRVHERPGAEFFWLAGFNAGDIIAPWLNATRRYRLTAWPDFGVIRPEAAVLRVVATLSAEPLDLQTLAIRARVTLGFASRVCNALSLVDALAVAEPARTASSAAAVNQPRGGFSGFLRKLRSHLGLGEAA
jgi:hypothetical protein